MARIYKRGRRYWLDFTDAAGRRVREPAGVTDKTLAQVALATKIKDEDRKRVGLLPIAAAKVMGFDEVLDAWHAFKRSRSHGKVRYADEARRDLKREAKLMGWRTVLDPDAWSIDQWLQGMLDDGISASTANSLRARLSSVLAFAVSMQLRPDNPCELAPPLSTHEVMARCALSAEATGDLVTKTPDPRGATYGFLVLSGLRRSEALGVELAWIDEAAGVIRLPSTLTKSKRAEIIALGHGLAEMIRRLRPFVPGNGKLLAEVPSCETLRADLAALGHDPAGVVVHGLRHTLSSLAPDAGVPFEDHPKIMRHSSLDLTMRVYQHREARRLAVSLDRIADACGILPAQPVAGASGA